LAARLYGGAMRQKLILLIIVFGVLLFQPGWAFSAGLPDRWERGVFIIETPRPAGETCPPNQRKISSGEEATQPKFCPIATSFAMQICGKNVLISNRHVFESNMPLYVRVEGKSGGSLQLPVGKEWRPHPNPKIDLAISVVHRPQDVEMEEIHISFFNEDKSRQATEPTSLFLALSQLRPGDEIFTVGFPASIPGVQDILKTHNKPLVRGGIISLVLPGENMIGDREVADIFLLDSWAFPGNSGSPVFWKPTTTMYSDRGFMIERPYIIGVVSAFLPSTGLAIIQAADGIEPTVAQFPGATCVPRPKISQ
jgi:hypothetical protein